MGTYGEEKQKEPCRIYQHSCVYDCVFAPFASGQHPNYDWTIIIVRVYFKPNPISTVVCFH